MHPTTQIFNTFLYSIILASTHCFNSSVQSFFTSISTTLSIENLTYHLNGFGNNFNMVNDNTPVRDLAHDAMEIAHDQSLCMCWCYQHYSSLCFRHAAFVDLRCRTFLKRPRGKSDHYSFSSNDSRLACYSNRQHGQFKTF